MDGQDSVELVAGQGGTVGSGEQPCCGITGAGADSPGGLTWGTGLWVGGGEPQVRELSSALRALALTTLHLRYGFSSDLFSFW